MKRPRHAGAPSPQWQRPPLFASTFASFIPVPRVRVAPAFAVVTLAALVLASLTSPVLISHLGSLVPAECAAGETGQTGANAQGSIPAEKDPLLTTITYSLQERQEIITGIWEKIDLWYSYFDEKGIDWNKIKEKYLTEVEGVTSDWEFFQKVAAMIRELHDGHSYVYDYPKPISFRYGRPECEILEADGKPIVARVTPGSDAAAKGVVPGLEVVSADGIPAQERIAMIIPRVTASTPWYARRLAHLNLLHGELSKDVKVEFRRPDGSTFSAVLKRAPVSMETVRIESKVLSGDIGYIKLPSLSANRLGLKSDNAIVAEFDRALERVKNTKALIIDFRGNGGGNDAAGNQCAARLLTEPTPFPTNVTKMVTFGKAWYTPRMSRIVKPRGPWQYTGPVVLLIDEMVFSSAEHVVAGLHDSGRAVTIGRNTAGSSGNPVDLEVKGFKFQVSRWKEYRVDGTLIEGNGVPADVVVNPTLADVVAGVDTVLERAIEYLTVNAHP